MIPCNAEAGTFASTNKRCKSDYGSVLLSHALYISIVAKRANTKQLFNRKFDNFNRHCVHHRIFPPEEEGGATKLALSVLAAAEEAEEEERRCQRSAALPLRAAAMAPPHVGITLHDADQKYDIARKHLACSVRIPPLVRSQRAPLLRPPSLVQTTREYACGNTNIGLLRTRTWASW